MNALEIKESRKKLGLNQTEFGQVLGVGLRIVQYWEKGEKSMPETTIILLKKLLNEQSAYYPENNIENYVNETQNIL